jgi:hypothetical protein
MMTSDVIQGRRISTSSHLVPRRESLAQEWQTPVLLSLVIRYFELDSPQSVLVPSELVGCHIIYPPNRDCQHKIYFFFRTFGRSQIGGMPSILVL